MGCVGAVLYIKTTEDVSKNIHLTSYDGLGAHDAFPALQEMNANLPSKEVTFSYRLRRG